ncbi:MAG: flavodoxin family protein [Firmicutes bacterium]|jgi:multimeric flavodoxin WrbA|nr:flavodoxin family protein [Bacillota bacterium]
MKICVLSGNPKKEGLCQSVIEAAKSGAREAGAEVDEIRLTDYKLERCQVCGSGWGTCRNENYCTFGDDGFNEVRERLQASDAIIIATPVYWGEVTEVLKSFLDRLRRCEFNQDTVLRKKQVLLIAVPGGSGNGLLSCLGQMERFCQHTGAIIYDYFGVNRWNNDYKKAAVKAAAYALASGRKNGDTVS